MNMNANIPPCLKFLIQFFWITLNSKSKSLAFSLWCFLNKPEGLSTNFILLFFISEAQLRSSKDSKSLTKINQVHRNFASLLLTRKLWTELKGWHAELFNIWKQQWCTILLNCKGWFPKGIHLERKKANNISKKTHT